MDKNELIEQLAAASHDSWAHWMIYLFSKSDRLADGSMLIPHSLVERWQRQVSTEYANLSEQEKQSDRNEVERILPIIRTFQEQAV